METQEERLGKYAGNKRMRTSQVQRNTLATGSKKRKASAPDASHAEPAGHSTQMNISTKKSKNPAPPDSPAERKPRSKKLEHGEKRLRKFRKHAPQTYLDRYERAMSQRMFLIDRERKVVNEGEGRGEQYEEEVFDMAGTTGNVYQVTISKVPRCTCPDARKNRMLCKHIIYVLVNVLKAPQDLQYQLALLSTELSQIFAHAPSNPQSSDGSQEPGTSTAGKRKPIEGDCPICVMEFELKEEEKGEILWCKAACGNNVHKACFEQWARSKPGDVKCVFCRTPWKGDEETVKRIAKSGMKNAEGYVNVAGQLGLSGRRDTTTYSRWGGWNG
ncbi:hypothetical protein GQ43DRAFT_389193, partial [Delitschia confertaspora ATCC 74209]